MTHYFKSCCDSSFTFTLTNSPTLTLGDIKYVIVPNYFSGCCTVVDYLYPESPTYSFLSPGVTLEGSYANCGVCTASYVCNRVTGISECDIVTISPMTITCSPNLSNNSITMLVSGGTPPYKILWSTGTLGPTLTNATPNGVYSVTVTDYNWPNGGSDYTATTTCSLIVPSQTPSPTPTPTPTPIPVVYPNLCLQYTINNVTTLYTFIPTGNIVNGKPTWSSGSLVISWGGLQSPYWFVIINRTTLQITNPNTPPIGVWSSFGVPASATSYIGTCNSPVMSLTLPNISAPNCVNTSTGSIIVNAINAQSPVLYSKNGGVTTQLSPIFNGLPAGSYNIWVQDGSSNISQQTAVVPAGPPTNSYNLIIDSTIIPLSSTQSQLTFKIVVRDTNNTIISNLPAGTIITFNLSEYNKFMVATNPAYGSQSKTVQVHKNGVPVGIAPTTSSSTQIVPTGVAGCSGGTQEYSTATTLNYNGITISGADVISGTVVTSVTRLNTLSCYVKSTDNVSINSSSINNGCTCCNVTGSPTSNTMTINGK